jgi:hypothetical protein
VKITFGKESEYDEYKAKNTDPYGNAVIVYSERWANLMEDQMDAQGIDRGIIGSVYQFIADNAKQLSHEADTDGITGFMYGCAVSGLSRFWVYGEHLRQWHNLSTQMNNGGNRANISGGVLNPAIVSIG